VDYMSFQVGSSIYVMGYGPFRGLRGTIQNIEENFSQDRFFNFYLVKLEGKNLLEHMWFEYDDLGLVCLREVDYLSEA
jgi:hypothetical protein